VQQKKAIDLLTEEAEDLRADFEGRHSGKSKICLRSKFFDYLPGSFVILVTIDSHKIVPGLIAGNSLVKIFDALEILQVVKLILNSTMHGLNIAVITPGPRRYAFVSATEGLHCCFKTTSGAILPETTYEFGAVVGLELQFFHIYTTPE